MPAVRKAYAQSGWNPSGVDYTILRGIYANLGGGYNWLKEGGGVIQYAPFIANMYMGLIQQLGDNGFLQYLMGHGLTLVFPLLLTSRT